MQSSYLYEILYLNGTGTNDRGVVILQKNSIVGAACFELCSMDVAWNYIC